MRGLFWLCVLGFTLVTSMLLLVRMTLVTRRLQLDGLYLASE
jgi:hypothetical protein